MSLPESSKQDATLANTYEARPGVSDATATGPSSVSNEQLSSSVKGSLDNIAISEQFPTAQGAAEAVKTGAGSLIAGISNLALGAKDTVVQNAAETHPESDNVSKVDDLHIPGAFAEETNDAEDIAAVKQGLQSAANTLPSKQQIPSVPMGSLTNQQSKSQGARQEQAFADGTENINSVGVNSTTNTLAGQVPLESRGVPRVVSDSQRLAGVSPGPSSITEAVLEKKQLERELKRDVPLAAVSSSGSTNNFSAQAGGVPGVASNPEAVEETRQSTGQIITGTLTSGASAVKDAATYARQKTHEATGTDPVAVLPESAQQAIDGEVIAPNTNRRTNAGDRGGQNVTDTLASGTSAARSVAAGAATYARQKTFETTGTDPVSVLPTSIQKNIDGQTSAQTGTNLSRPSDSTFPREPNVGSHSHGVDLQAGVHNGVVGDHLDDDSEASHRTLSGSHSGHWQPGTSATVAHIPSLKDVDLSSGVKNTVVGSGAREAFAENAEKDRSRSSTNGLDEYIDGTDRKR